MYGRGHELAELTAGILAATNGPGRLLVIEGEAGIGKTTLVNAALAGRGLTVLRARGNPLDQDFPFGVARRVRPGAGRTRLAAGVPGARRAGRSGADQR